ncbi:hypothetical protein J3F84DRAFT_58293 [Trichoderma pleuroticola]
MPTLSTLMAQFRLPKGTSKYMMQTPLANTLKANPRLPQKGKAVGLPAAAGVGRAAVSSKLLLLRTSFSSDWPLLEPNHVRTDASQHFLLLVSRRTRPVPDTLCPAPVPAHRRVSPIPRYARCTCRLLVRPSAFSSSWMQLDKSPRHTNIPWALFRHLFGIFVFFFFTFFFSLIIPKRLYIRRPVPSWSWRVSMTIHSVSAHLVSTCE